MLWSDGFLPISVRRSSLSMLSSWVLVFSAGVVIM